MGTTILGLLAQSTTRKRNPALTSCAQAGLDPFPLGAPVLEPDLDLDPRTNAARRLSEISRGGASHHVVSLGWICQSEGPGLMALERRLLLSSI
nr:hypothetical protein BaRGS_021328 [Batillaria attramentaria]